MPTHIKYYSQAEPSIESELLKLSEIRPIVNYQVIKKGFCDPHITSKMTIPKTIRRLIFKHVFVT